MLKNLVKQESTIHIGGKEYRIRYSLNALLCLEMMYKPLDEILQTDWKKWSIEDVLQLSRAAMCELPWNRKAVNERDFERVRPTLAKLGEKIEPKDLMKLKLEIINAIIKALPDNPDTFDQPTTATNEGHQRAIFVDIIGRSEKEYWSSTNKEIRERINWYLEAKGIKEIPVLIKKFADQ